MSRKFTELQLEMLTAYADGCTDAAETSEVETLLAADADYKALLEIEKATKSLLKNRLKNVEPPSNMLQNIHTGIDEVYASAKRTSATTGNTITSSIQKPEKNFSRYYLYSIAAAAIILVVVSFKILKNPGTIPANKNYETVSRNIFNQIEKGDVKVQYATKDPKELQKYFDGKTDFKVYIPDIKDAELVGGMVNEVEGQKLVHFVHKCKDGNLIYTMQGCKTATMKSDHLALDEPCMQRIQEGKNWFETNCGKGDSKDNMVLWSKDDCVCTSVSKEEPAMITAVLNSVK